MAKILFKKKIYGIDKNCKDEFGEYRWYFNVYRCFSRIGITYQIETSDFTTNQRKLKDCMNVALIHLESDMPRYYRLKDEIFKKKLHNQLW